ncbi:MAG: carbohydrate-binding domain-containing protein [Clostridia bacterium]|nr:carbohydrate-binding domain-containing protein [Clostridia bacterium]
MKRITSILLLISLFMTLVSCSKEEELPLTVPSTLDVELADLSEMDFSFSDRDLDPSYDPDEVRTPTGDGVKTVTAAGVYEFSGTGVSQIVVEAGEKDKVQIVLDGATVENPDGPAILILSADKVFITAKDGTENRLSDGSSYTLEKDGSAVDAAVFSKADLTLNGKGSLSVTGNFKHGIVSKDDLVLAGCNLSVKAESAALCGKDCIKATDSTVTAEAGSDGFRSDHTEDEACGYLYFENSRITVTAGNDGVQAETVVKALNTDFEIVSGGGAGGSLSNSSESYKGIKGGSDVLLSGGSVTVSSKDDAIHSNHSISITSGTLLLSSGDDGIHADTDLSVSGGTITVSKSYEGLEGSRILISGGNINVTASDDGYNAAGGNDSSGMGGMVEGGGFGGRPGMGHFSSSTGTIVISGGYAVINASGDGVDSNGEIQVTGGVTLVSGPTNSGNGSFDYGTSATVTGGVLVALGSSGMAQGFTEASQGAMLVHFDSQSADTSFALCDGDGNALVSFTPPKSYSSAVVTSPHLEKGKTYTLVAGGKVADADENGFAQMARCEGGTTLATVELSELLFSQGGMGGGMMPGGGGGMMPGGGGMRPDGGMGGGRPGRF